MHRQVILKPGFLKQVEEMTANEKSDNAKNRVDFEDAMDPSLYFEILHLQLCVVEGTISRLLRLPCIDLRDVSTFNKNSKFASLIRRSINEFISVHIP